MHGALEADPNRFHTGPEKPGKYAVFTISPGKLGIVRKISVTFIQVREKPKENKLFSARIISLTQNEAVCQVVVPFAVGICKLYHIPSVLASICRLPIFVNI